MSTIAKRATSVLKSYMQECKERRGQIRKQSESLKKKVIVAKARKELSGFVAKKHITEETVEVLYHNYLVKFTPGAYVSIEAGWDIWGEYPKIKELEATQGHLCSCATWCRNALSRPSWVSRIVSHIRVQEGKRKAADIDVSDAQLAAYVKDYVKKAVLPEGCSL